MEEGGKGEERGKRRGRGGRDGGKEEGLGGEESQPATKGKKRKEQNKEEQERVSHNVKIIFLLVVFPLTVSDGRDY